MCPNFNLSPLKRHQTLWVCRLCLGMQGRKNSIQLFIIGWSAKCKSLLNFRIESFSQRLKCYFEFFLCIKTGFERKKKTIQIHQMCVEHKTINNTHLGKRNFVQRTGQVFEVRTPCHTKHTGSFFTYATNINGNSTEDFYLNEYTNKCRSAE